MHHLMKKNIRGKSELLKTEKSLGAAEIDINENLELSKRNLDSLKKELQDAINEIEKLIERDKDFKTGL